MTASAKGTGEDPGVNVKAKSGLNRSILVTGWAEIEQMLAYKTRVAYVNPPFTSRRCSRPSRFSVYKLWRSGPCRPERSQYHLGLRDWGYCTGRGVLGRDLYDL